MTRTPIAQQLRERIDKWDCTKLKSFCTTKETITKLKKQPTEWERIFACFTCDRGLITRVYRKFKKLIPQKINNPLNKWANELTRQSSKEVQMAN
jgi:hypothetical protein